MRFMPLHSSRAKSLRLPRVYRPQLETLETRNLLSTCTVDRLTDNNPGGGGEGSNGMGDLRWCITDSLFREDTINFAVMGTINLNARLPNLTRSVSINGPGPSLVTVRRASGGDYYVLSVSAGVSVAVSGLTISNGNNGGGILNQGSLTVNNSLISGNTDDGIFNIGNLTVNSTTITGNSAIGGAGIFNEGGTLTINSSTIANNTGVGLYNAGVTVTVNNCTISGNSAGGIGNVDGMLTVLNSTITGNSAAARGGGIRNDARMSSRNTVIARNTAPSGPDLYGNMGSQGYNLLANPQDASGWISTDLLHVDPALGPLQNNGGPTPTMALLAGSPALDAGDPSQVNTPDQRGVPRTGGVNIGAYQASATTFLVAGFPSPINAGASGLVTITARDSYGSTAFGYRGTVHLTSSDSQASVPADYTFTAADNGVHTPTATLKTAGTQSLIATDTGTATLTGTQSGIVVSPAAPDHFTIMASVESTQAGIPFDITAAVQDAFGNTVTNYTGTVHFRSNDPQGLLPSHYTFTAADNGAHTFSVTLGTAGIRDITIRDKSTHTIKGRATITVTPDPAVAFQVIAPAGAASGTPFDVSLIAVDPYGNTDTNYQGTVTWTTTDPDPSVQLPAEYAFQVSDAGMATFPGGVTLITQGDQTITATDTASGITGSAIVTVLPPGSGPGRAAGKRIAMAGGMIQASQVLSEMGVPMPGVRGTRPVERGPRHLTPEDAEGFFAVTAGEGQRVSWRGYSPGDLKIGPVILEGLFEDDGAELFSPL